MAPSRKDIFKTSSEMPSGARKLRGKKKRTPFERIGLLCVLVLALFTAFVLLMRLEALQIRGVEVSGVEVLSEETLRLAAERHLEGFYFYLVPKTNIFFYPSGEIAEEILKAHSRIELLELSAGFDRILSLSIKERHLAYVLCEGAGFALPCFSVDSVGYIFDSAPSFSGPLIPLYMRTDTASSTPVGTYFLDALELARTDQVRDAFAAVFEKHALPVKLLGVELDELGDYALVYTVDDHRGRIWFRDGFPHELARVLDLALSNPVFVSKVSDFSDLEKLDLRFGKKVYYSFTDFESVNPLSASSTEQ